MLSNIAACLVEDFVDFVVPDDRWKGFWVGRLVEMILRIKVGAGAKWKLKWEINDVVNEVGTGVCL